SRSTEALSRNLAAFNAGRFRPGLPQGDWADALEKERYMLHLEGEYVERERLLIVGQANEVPRDAEGFVRWFDDLRENGPGQSGPLVPWLAHAAPRDALIWFLEPEVAGEGGFDDLVALTQVKLPDRAKR